MQGPLFNYIVGQLGKPSKVVTDQFNRSSKSAGRGDQRNCQQTLRPVPEKGKRKVGAPALRPQ
jgi:hypothetical protein